MALYHQHDEFTYAAGDGVEGTSDCRGAGQRRADVLSNKQPRSNLDKAGRQIAEAQGLRFELSLQGILMTRRSSPRCSRHECSLRPAMRSFTILRHILPQSWRDTCSSTLHRQLSRR
jgi:hypothetical protein